MENRKGSQAQMPLGMFSAWAWSRVFGTRELAMRSLNLLWAAIALAALARVGKQISIPWLPFLFSIQPFVAVVISLPDNCEIKCGDEGCFLGMGAGVFRFGSGG